MSDALLLVKKFFPNVYRVRDASKSVDIEVRDYDNKSEMKDHENCALAQATKRQFKTHQVVIGLTALYVIKGNVATRYKLPESVSREIISFDRHAKFTPGTYHLKPPSGTQRLGESKVRANRKPKTSDRSAPRARKAPPPGIRTMLRAVEGETPEPPAKRDAK